MSKAKELRDKFNKELKELQDSCPHVKSQVLPYMWARGQHHGNVRVCLECDVIIEHVPLDGQYELMLQA